MRKMKLLALCLVGIAAICILASEQPHGGATGFAIKPEAIEEETPEALTKVVSGSLIAITKDWDDNPGDDGFVLYPDLLDIEKQAVKWGGIELPVEIKIYTVKLENLKEVEDRLVYSSASSISSWKDGDFMFREGIKIFFKDIRVTASDRDYGTAHTAVILPDGRKIEAKDDIVRLKP